MIGKGRNKEQLKVEKGGYVEKTAVKTKENLVEFEHLRQWFFKSTLILSLNLFFLQLRLLDYFSQSKS